MLVRRKHLCLAFRTCRGFRCCVDGFTILASEAEAPRVLRLEPLQTCSTLKQKSLLELSSAAKSSNLFEKRRLRVPRHPRESKLFGSGGVQGLIRGGICETLPSVLKRDFSSGRISSAHRKTGSQFQLSQIALTPTSYAA